MLDCVKWNEPLIVFRRPHLKKRREFKITLAASFVADNSVGSYRYSAKNFRTANDETQARTDGCR